MKYGVTGSFTGIVTSNTYNPRLQPVIISAASPSQTVLSLSYGFNLGTADNGNVFQIQNNMDSARTQTFTYDELNRVKTAEVPTAWGLSFGYDVWANFLTQTVTKGSAPMLNVAANTKNQIVGFTYDAAGNLSNDGAQSYTYDGENRLSAAAGVTYTYDGDGKRVRKSNGKLYWTGIGSDALVESDLSGNVNKEFIFFGGKRIARIDITGGGAVRYFFSDHLGTSRIVTNATGTVLDDADFYPFGAERTVLSGSGNNYKFTGKERDSESNLDYFGARYYGSQTGRWLSPDWSANPSPVPYADLTDPQTLNLYGYVRNNPLSHADADGHCCDLNDVVNFAAGAANAYGSDNLFGAGRVEQTTAAGKIGAAFGDAAATVQGVQETLTGVGGEVGGLVLDATGVGAAVGVPAGVVSTGLILHGSATAITGGANLMKAANDSSGGYKPGGDFSKETKQQAAEKAGNKCQNCGAETVPAQKSQKGVTPPKNEGQTDHIQPKSKGGTNDPANAQHLCRDCNQNKGNKEPESK